MRLYDYRSMEWVDAPAKAQQAEAYSRSLAVAPPPPVAPRPNPGELPGAYANRLISAGYDPTKGDAAYFLSCYEAMGYRGWMEKKVKAEKPKPPVKPEPLRAKVKDWAKDFWNYPAAVEAIMGPPEPWAEALMKRLTA